MNLLAALVLASLVAAPVPKDDPGKEAQAALQGKWKQIEFIKNGIDRTQDKGGWERVVIKGDKLTISDGKNEESATLSIDHKTDPKSFDMKVVEQGRELVIKGIYKLEKDKLTICFGLEGRVRPKEFKSEKCSDIGLMVLERVKK